MIFIKPGLKFLSKPAIYKMIALALVLDLIFHSFSPIQKAQAATLNAGSNFTACTAQAVLSPWAGYATVYWTFASAVGNTQAAYQVQIDDDSGFGSVNVDSGVVSNAAARSYSTGGLSLNIRYYWRLQITDNNSSVTDWISGDSFLLLIPSINLKGGLRIRGDIRLK